MTSIDNAMVLDVFDIFRFIFGMLILTYASYLDLKSRKVKNSVWIVLGIGATIILFFNLLFIENLENVHNYLIILAPIFILFMYFLTCDYIFDLKTKKINYPWLALIIIGIVVIVYQTISFWSDSWLNLFYLQLVSIMILIFIFYLFYLTNLLHGGADTKAMMAIAILVPFYPDFLQFPVWNVSYGIASLALELVFPYALIILFNAVIISVFIPIGFGIYNTSKGNFKFPHMFLGYKMEIDKVTKKFVWLMERVEDGKIYSVLRPSKVDDLKLEDEIQKLKKVGAKQVWVTPQIPFMITLTIGYAFAFLIGNIMFLIVNLFV